MSTNVLPAAVLALTLLVTPTGAADQPTAQPDAEAVRALIGELGSSRFTEREAAYRKLATMGEDAAPALRAALEAPDPEVRRQAARLLREAQDRLANRAIKFARRGEAERMAVALTALRTEEDAQAFDAAQNLAWDLADTTNWSAVKKEGVLELRYRKQFPFVPRVRSEGLFEPTAVDGDRVGIGGLYVRAAGVSTRGHISSSVVVSDGPVSALSIFTSIVVSSERVFARRSLGSAVVICGGDFEVDSRSSAPLQNGLVVARGEVRVSDARGSILVAGRGVFVGGERQKETEKDKALKEAVFKLIHFFDPGIDAEPADKGMKVTRVREGKPGSDIGLKAGDVVLSVNGTATDSAESFRQALLRASVREKNAFAVRRDGKAVELAVKFPD
jgi:hypothetical protein